MTAMLIMLEPATPHKVIGVVSEKAIHRHAPDFLGFLVQVLHKVPDIGKAMSMPIG
jgi:hypothetical protein